MLLVVNRTGLLSKYQDISSRQCEMTDVSTNGAIFEIIYPATVLLLVFRLIVSIISLSKVIQTNPKTPFYKSPCVKSK